MNAPIRDTGKTMDTFAVMLERNSLQKLIDISESPTLRGSVRTVEIGTHHLSQDFYNRHVRQASPCLEDSEDDDGMSGVYDSIVAEDVAYIESMREAEAMGRDDDMFYSSRLLEQEEFTTRGIDVAYLTRALTGLPNCNKICISNTGSPSGLNRLENLLRFRLCTGFDLDSRDSRDFVTHVLRTTLAAVTASRITLAEIDISVGLTDKQRGFGSITSDALYLPNSYRQLIHQKLTTVTSLRLVVNTGSDECWDDNAATFVRQFPNITHFRLQLDGQGSGVEFSHLTEALQSLPLEVFELVSCSTIQANLMPLLLCHRARAEEQAALKEIILESVNIEKGPGIG